MQRPGNFDENVKARMFISKQTYEGIQISTYAMISVVKFLLSKGMSFVLTNRFCQDPVEQYFGKQRSFGRRSDNPTVQSFGFGDNKIRIQRSNLQVEGNCEGSSSKGKSWRNVDNDPLAKRKRKN